MYLNVEILDDRHICVIDPVNYEVTLTRAAVVWCFRRHKNIFWGCIVGDLLNTEMVLTYTSLYNHMVGHPRCVFINYIWLSITRRSRHGDEKSKKLIIQYTIIR